MWVANSPRRPLPAKRVPWVRSRAQVRRGDAARAEGEQADQHDPDQQRVRGKARDELAVQEAVQRYGAHGSPLPHLIDGIRTAKKRPIGAARLGMDAYRALSSDLPSAYFANVENRLADEPRQLAPALEAVAAVHGLGARRAERDARRLA